MTLGRKIVKWGLYGILGLLGLVLIKGVLGGTEKAITSPEVNAVETAQVPYCYSKSSIQKVIETIAETSNARHLNIQIVSIESAKQTGFDESLNKRSCIGTAVTDTGDRSEISYSFMQGTDGYLTVETGDAEGDVPVCDNQTALNQLEPFIEAKGNYQGDVQSIDNIRESSYDANAGVRNCEADMLVHIAAEGIMVQGKLTYAYTLKNGELAMKTNYVQTGMYPVR